MLFNSYEFIFVFLPVSLSVFFLLGHRGFRREAVAWLVAVSLFFYGWWNPSYLLLLVGSIVLNFALGRWLTRSHGDLVPLLSRRLVLGFGVSINLLSIGYFKYANFFIGNINIALGADYYLESIVLPLAISFFTFQQITFLVDSYRGLTNEADFLNYCLFVSFFPQLIAGPIVHHREILPQFLGNSIFRVGHVNLALGITIFSIGLFKKTVLADGISVYSNRVFDAAEAGEPLDFFRAWSGALAYTFQLYFDFSGYSDMAIGAARLFGIRLPINFNSPYKAVNIIDFWRRWHITLSRFLRDYLYVALGGNRKGSTRRFINLMATMVIGGLWHGAGWTFVAWGALHGGYLIVNHGWHSLRRALHGGELPESTWLGRRLAQAVTLLAVIVGWVFFRASTFDGALAVLEGMSGLNGVSLPGIVAYRFEPLADLLATSGVQFTSGGGREFLLAWTWIILLSPIVLMAPNSLELTRRFRPALHLRSHVAKDTEASPLVRSGYLAESLAWRPSTAWAIAIGIVAAGGLLALPQVSVFLYFQF